MVPEPVMEPVVEVAHPIASEGARMLELARIFARGGTCEADDDDDGMLALLTAIRVKSNCRRNESAYRLLDVLHKHAEFADVRQKLFELVAQPGKNWWGAHKEERTLLRTKYGVE